MAEELTDLRRIEEGNPQLIGRSGKKYNIHTLISGKKMAEYEVAFREMGTGMSMQSLHQELTKDYNLLTQSKVKKSKSGEITFDSNNVQVALSLFNIISGIHKIRERRSSVMKIAHLYIVEEGKHPGIYDEDAENQKIADLETEYPYEDFFRAATSGLKKYIDDLNELSRLGSEMPILDQD